MRVHTRNGAFAVTSQRRPRCDLAVILLADRARGAEPSARFPMHRRRRGSVRDGTVAYRTAPAGSIRRPSMLFNR